MSFRGEQIEKAREILLSHEAELLTNYRQRLLERALQEVPIAIRAVKDKAISQVFAKELAVLDPQARELMERVLTYMEKKCISIPMKAARRAKIG
ncbi:MAG: hypothetical protein HC821_05745 [Lewinella sp.]|nr:hypothetical protein [Lewinella sp.]